MKRHPSSDQHYPIDISKLPPSWAVAPVGDFIKDIRAGFACGRHSSDAQGTVHLRPMNVSRAGRIALDDVRYIDPQDAQNKPSVAPGDVLFNNTNSAELVGKTAAVEEGTSAFSNHMTRLRPPEGVSHRFVAAQLHYLWEHGYFKYRRTQHVNQASISIKTLAESVPFVLPPTEEQHRIIREVDRIVDRIDAAEAVLTTTLKRLREYEHGVLKHAALGHLVMTEAQIALKEDRPYESGADLLRNLHGDWTQFPQFVVDQTIGFSKEPLAPLPKGWIWTTVAAVGQVTLGRQRAPRYHLGPDMRPYLRVANVFEDRIDTQDVHEMNFSPDEYESFGLRHGDILLNEGQSPELVGRAAMYRGEVPGACFQNTLIRFRARNGISPTFALLVFRHYLHAGRFQKAARWSTNIAHLSSDRFSRLEFPLPPLAEQERIVVEANRRLEAADQLRTTISTIVGRLTDARRSVFNSAFSAALVPTNPSDKSALDLLDRLRRQPLMNRPKFVQQRHDGPPASRAAAVGEVLRNLSDRVSPEKLFATMNFTEERVDEFFKLLKREVEAGRMTQVTDAKGRCLLSYDRRGGRS